MSLIAEETSSQSAAVIAKEERLRELFRRLRRVIVAFSGGIDSAYVAFIAHQELGANMLAVTGDSPSLSDWQKVEAIKYAEQFGIPHEIISTEEMNDPNYSSNPVNRCYYCKRELHTKLRQLAQERGFNAICDGNNMDDLGDYRPGRQAAQELGVISPLVECGITKAELRQLARRAGLPIWDKPASACLSSRIPYGMPVTIEKLTVIDRGEALMRELGFRVFRVRHHGDIVRIEISPEEMPRAMQMDMAALLARRFKALGFKYVALDLEGYRTGSMNEAIRASRR